MSNLQKYIASRKETDKDFAKKYEESFESFKIENNLSELNKNDDWKKAREILAKTPNTEVDDYDKL